MNPSPKRRVTPDDQLHFQRSISTDSQGRDEIDRELEDEIDPLALDHPPGRRKQSEISRLDAIFDELERRNHS